MKLSNRPTQNGIVTGAIALGLLAGLPVLAWAVDLAKVNGKSITDGDVKGALMGMNEGQRQSFLADPASRRQVLLSLVDQELLQQQAEKEKLDQDAEYKQALAMFRRSYLADRILQKNIGLKLNDAAARKHYDAHKSRYSTDQVQVQHILASDEVQARELLQKAKAPNADFEELAEKFSRDPSAKNNRGSIGWILRDAPYVEEFKEAAFSGKPGEILGPVKTIFGYHLIKVVDRKVGKQLEYTEVELRVRNDLRQELVQGYLGKLKQQAKIQVDDKALNKF